jgi:hypothetical protein
VLGNEMDYRALALHPAVAGQHTSRRNNPPLASETPAQTPPQRSERTLALGVRAITLPTLARDASKLTLVRLQ